ncbi:MAG TPA: ATP-binding cassette domain-containing protein [Bacilli bacterium]|nr:ATP-binding cassette domain-containing protein [Bacilli bacterium]
MSDKKIDNNIELVEEKPVRERRQTKFKQELVDEDIILSVRHLKQYFTSGYGANKFRNKAVHGISFDIKKGEVFGLVGESGCGKTTTGRSIIRLYDITSGSVYFKGHRINAGSRWNEKEIKWKRIRARKKIKELREQMRIEISEIYNEDQENMHEIVANIEQRFESEIKAIQEEVDEIVAVQKEKIKQIKFDNANVDPDIMSKMQMIFQDPVDSLNPRMTVEDIIQEGLQIQGFKNREENSKKVVEALERVGLIADYASRYPHEFSGGQRQRIGIARALIMNPELIIADEPISALDVSIRAQIINLLNDLRNEYGLTILFIAHDLSVVKYFCDRIAVMYYGVIVELTTSDELFKHPLHPYTKALLSAIPKPDPLSEKVRQRVTYNPVTAHDYSKEKPTLQEILPGHFILANSAEMEQYREEIAEIDRAAAEK